MERVERPGQVAAIGSRAIGSRAIGSRAWRGRAPSGDGGHDGAYLERRAQLPDRAVDHRHIRHTRAAGAVLLL
eukprot:scaffold69790_cov58-Phaeocystis_antarctica.AAC.8